MEKLVTNYHTHTKRCGHAYGEDEDFVLSAIKYGIKELGFSDHISFKNISAPYMRQDRRMLSDYISSISHLKEKYKDNKEVSQRIDDYINRNYKYVMPINIFRMTSTIELSYLRNDLKKFIIPESYYYLDNFTELEKYIEKNIKFTDEVIENSFKVVKDEDICRKKY